jgi:capping protein alpha
VPVCVCVLCRASLDDELQSHVADAFPDARYAVYGSEGAQGVKTLTACISSAKFNPSNFWNGRWRSVWTVTLGADQATWAVEGTFKVREQHWPVFRRALRHRRYHPPRNAFQPS